MARETAEAVQRPPRFVGTPSEFITPATELSELPADRRASIRATTACSAGSSTSSACSTEAVARRSTDEPALLGLDPAAIAEALRNQRTVELGYGPDDLPQGGPHRVIGIVLGDLAGVGAEHPAFRLPDQPERSFLDRQAASEPVEPGAQNAVGTALLDGIDRRRQALTLQRLDRARDGVVGHHLDYTVAVGLRPGADRLALGLQAELFDLAFCGAPEVADQP